MTTRKSVNNSELIENPETKSSQDTKMAQAGNSAGFDVRRQLLEMKGARVRVPGSSSISLVEYATGRSGNPVRFYPGNEARIEKKLAKLALPDPKRMFFPGRPKKSWANRGRMMLERLRGLRVNATKYVNSTKKKLRSELSDLARQLGYGRKETRRFIGTTRLKKHQIRNLLVSNRARVAPLFREARERATRRARAIQDELVSAAQMTETFRVYYGSAPLVRAMGTSGLSVAFTPGNYRTDGFVTIQVRELPADVLNYIARLMGNSRLRFDLSEYEVPTSSPLGRYVRERIMAAIDVQVQSIINTLKSKSREKFEWQDTVYGSVSLIMRDNMSLTPFDNLRFLELNYSMPVAGDQSIVEASCPKNVSCFEKGMFYFTSTSEGARKGFARFTPSYIADGLRTICNVDTREKKGVSPAEIRIWNEHPMGGRNKFSHIFIDPLGKVLDSSVTPKGARVTCTWICQNGHYYVALDDRIRNQFANQFRPKTISLHGRKGSSMKLNVSDSTNIVELNVLNKSAEEILETVSSGVYDENDVIVVHITSEDGEVDHTLRQVPMVDMLIMGCEQTGSLPAEDDVAFSRGNLLRLKLPGLPLIMQKSEIKTIKTLCDIMNARNPVRKRHWLTENVSSLFGEYISTAGSKGGLVPQSTFSERALYMNTKYYARACVVDFRSLDAKIANFGSRKTLAFDVTKAYGAALAHPEDNWCCYSYLDEPIAYDANDPNHNGLRNCFLMLNSPKYGATRIHACEARALMDIGELRHTEIEMIWIPSETYDRDTYADSMRLWYCEDISDRAKKDGPNHWVGRATSRFWKKTKYFITDTFAEYEACLRDYPDLQVRKLGSLYYCSIDSRGLLSRNNNPVAHQVIGQCSAWGFRQIGLARKCGLIPLGIKTDCVFHHVPNGNKYEAIAKMTVMSDCWRMEEEEPGWGYEIFEYDDICDAMEAMAAKIKPVYAWDPEAICDEHKEEEEASMGEKYIGKPIDKLVRGYYPGQWKLEEGLSHYASPYMKAIERVNNEEFKAEATKINTETMTPLLSWLQREPKQNKEVRDDLEKLRCRSWDKVGVDDIVSDFASMLDGVVTSRIEANTKKNDGIDIAEIRALASSRLRDKETKKLVGTAEYRQKVKDARAKIKEIDKAETQARIQSVMRERAKNPKEKFDDMVDKILSVQGSSTNAIAVRVKREHGIDLFPGHGAFINGLPGTGKTRLICQLSKMANEKDVQIAILTFKGASSNNLCVKGVDCKTIDSFRSTKIGSDIIDAYKSLLLQMKKQRIGAIVVDEYGELPKYHMELLIRLSKNFPLYLFGDHEQAAPAYQDRLYEYHSIEGFRRACCYRWCKMEYNWSEELAGLQRCGKKLVNGMEALRADGQLNFRGRYARNALYDQEKAQREWDNVDRKWVEKKPVVETTEYLRADVIEMLMTREMPDKFKHHISQILMRTDYVVRDHLGVPCYSQKLKYHERGPSGTRIYSGDGTYQSMPGVMKTLFLHENHYDIDQSASHQYAIMAYCKTMGIDCPVLLKYVMNKKNWRMEVALHYHCPKDNVICMPSVAKQMFTAIMYGSSIEAFGKSREERDNKGQGQVNQQAFFKKQWSEEKYPDEKWRHHLQDSFAARYSRFHSDGNTHPHLLEMRDELKRIVRLLKQKPAFQKLMKIATDDAMRRDKKVRDIGVRTLCNEAQKIERQIMMEVTDYFGLEHANGLIHDGSHIRKETVDKMAESMGCSHSELVSKCVEHVTAKTGHEFKLEIKPFDLKEATTWLNKLSVLETPKKLKDYLPVNHIVKFHDTGNKWNQRIMDAICALEPHEPMTIIGSPVHPDATEEERREKLKKSGNKRDWALPGYRLIKGMRITTRTNITCKSLGDEGNIRVHNCACGVIKQVLPESKNMVVEWYIGDRGRGVNTLLTNKSFKDYCQLDYAVTVNRVQGRTIDEHIYIWDTAPKTKWNKRGMVRNDLLMAMSRCKNIHQLHVERFYKPMPWTKYDVLPTPRPCTKVYGQIFTYPGLSRALFRITTKDGARKFITKTTAKKIYNDRKNRVEDSGKGNWKEKKETRAKDLNIIATAKPIILQEGYYADKKSVFIAVPIAFSKYLSTLATSAETKAVPTVVTKKPCFRRSKTIHCTIDKKTHRIHGYYWKVVMEQVTDHTLGSRTQYNAGDVVRVRFDKRYKKIGLEAAEELIMGSAPRGYEIHRKNYALWDQATSLWFSLMSNEHSTREEDDHIEWWHCVMSSTRDEHMECWYEMMENGFASD